MCAFNPGVRDRSGELLASGISGGLGALARGILQHRAKQEEKEREAAAFDVLRSITDPAIKDDALRAGIKGVGIDGAYEIAMQLKKEKEQAPLRELEMKLQQAQLDNLGLQQEAARARAAAQQRNVAAMQGVAPMLQGDAPDTMGALAQYLAKGGSDPQELQTLGALATTLLRRAPEKPTPGSAGFKPVEVPGLGTIVQDVATGEAVDGGKVIRPPDEKKNEQKALTSSEIERISKIEQAARDIEVLKARFASYNDPNFGGPVSGRVKALLKAGTDPQLAEIDNLVTAATPNLARGVFGETGVLTDTDIKLYKGLLPNANDTAQIRAQKMADLEARLKSTLDETLKTYAAAGRDVTGLRERIAGNGSGAPKTDASGTIPEFASPGQVEEALATGALNRGAIVRVGGQLYRAQ